MGDGYVTVTYEVSCTLCGPSYVADTILHLEKGVPIVDVDGYSECVKQWNKENKED